MRINSVPCRTCNSGTMIRRKVHRLSPIVALIGYILLIPSVLGILGSGLLMVAPLINPDSKSAKAPLVQENSAETATSSAAEDLRRRREPTPTTEGSLESSSRERLNDQLVTNQALDDKSAERMGAGVLAAFSVIGMVFWLVFGLIGWLLIMRKRILQCRSCGAVVAAS